MTGKLSPHFFRSEFACPCGCGFDTVDVMLITTLEDLRAHFARAVFISSGCRCRGYNRGIGGADLSQHLFAKAADIVVVEVAPRAVADYLRNKYPHSHGIGEYGTFTHVDVRNQMARWKS